LAVQAAFASANGLD